MRASRKSATTQSPTGGKSSWYLGTIDQYAGGSRCGWVFSRNADAQPLGPVPPVGNCGNSSGMQPERYGRRYNCPRGTCEKGTPIYLIGATPI